MKNSILHTLFLLFLGICFNSCKKDSTSQVSICSYLDSRLTYDSNNRISKILFSDGSYWVITYASSPAQVKVYGRDGYESQGSSVILNSLGYVTKQVDKNYNTNFTFEYDASGYLIKSSYDQNNYCLYSYTDGNLTSVKEYFSSFGIKNTLLITYYTDKPNTIPIQILPASIYTGVSSTIPGLTGKLSKNLIKTITYVGFFYSESSQVYTYLDDSNGNIGKMNIETTFLPSASKNNTISSNYFNYVCK